MRTRLKRMYAMDPRHRKERRYMYCTRRFEGFTPTNPEGHSRAIIVGHGYGKTPQQSRINARKRPYRRVTLAPKSARDLSDDRRYSRYIQEKYDNRFSKGVPSRHIDTLRAKLKCEHEYRETHPRAYSFAYVCDKCGSKGGIKPGAPDPLRNYF